MHGDDIVKIPIHVGGSQYAEVGVEITSKTADRLTDEDVVAAVRSNADLDALARDLKRRAEVGAEQ